jgi:hypothetical protein
VISSGVPKTVVVPMNESTAASSVAISSGTATPPNASSAGAAARGAAVSRELVVELDELRVAAARGDLVAQARKEVIAPHREVPDARREAFRMEAQPQHVHRLREERGRDADEEESDRRVARDEVPVPVDRDRGAGLVPFQHEVDRAARRAERRLARIGRAVNQALGRKGNVVSDRYHLRVLTCPRQVRSPMCS